MGPEDAREDHMIGKQKTECQYVSWHQPANLSPLPELSTQELRVFSNGCWVGGANSSLTLWRGSRAHTYIVCAPPPVTGIHCRLEMLSSTQCGGTLLWETAWPIKWAPGQPGLYRETLSPNTKKQININKQKWKRHQVAIWAHTAGTPRRWDSGTLASLLFI